MNSFKLNTNLLLVSHNLELQGATNSLYYLAKGFQAKGAKIKVISPTSGPMLEKYRQADIEVGICDWWSSKYNVSKNTEIIIVNTILGYKFILDNPSLRKNIIWIIRESEREIYEKKFTDLDLNLMTEVKKVVFVAESTREIYQDFDRGNFVTIHNGIDLREIDIFLKNNTQAGLRQKHGFGEDEKIISIVGTVCPRKGQLKFAEAAIDLLMKSDRPENFKFLIVGGGQPGNKYEQWIREMVRVAGWEKNVLFYNETPDFLEYILLADVFVCNSYVESFPRITLEAMALSKPIVATKVYGIKEQITDGENGLLINAGDKYGLADKVSKLLNNADWANSLGKQARITLEYNFTYEKMLEKYINIITANQ